MLYRLIMCIAVIGLVQEAAAADIDATYLRGTDSSYQVQQVGYPWYPTSAPAPSYPPISNGPIVPAPPAWSWTGFYVGGHVGAAVGTADFADPFGSSIFGDKVTTPGFLAGGQIGYNWQAPNSTWVLGVEADASWLTSDGTNTCFAFSGFLVSATCHADPNAIGSLTARGGYAFGPSGRTLLYAKGGAAWIHENVDTITNAGNLTLGGNQVPNLSTNASFMQLGWTVGAGLEQAVAPGWTVFLEYNYLSFGSDGIGTPESILQIIPGVNAYKIFPTGTTTVSQDIQEVKLGVNYKFGADPWAPWNSAAAVMPIKAPPVQAWLPGWDFEFGSRVWFSSGKFQWNIGAGPAGTGGNSDISRLTYDGLTGYTGEYFQRIDTPWGLFAKGNLGIGIVNGGQQNDEDWLIFAGTVPYSNTLSSTNDGKLGYGTLDLGYDVLRGPGYKVGPFVGYNYFTERWDTFGCAQIANQFSDCVPTVPSTTLIGTQDSTWQSLRVGMNSEVMLVPDLKLTADLAYLPYVSMTGRDNHLLRTTTTYFDQQGTGQGVQLEIIASYFVTDNFSVGVGGRYWAMWTTSGTDTCTGCGGAGVVSPSSPARFNTERYGTFLQADYRFGAPPEGFM
jgi:opacity protein-like surface antigen/outer membrane protease